MALKPIPGWLNPAYTLASTNASLQRLLNLYSEVIESGEEKTVGFLKGCPGLSAALITLPTSPVRGLLAAGTPLNPLSGTGGRLFAVAGDTLYEISSAGASINTIAVGPAGWLAGTAGAGVGRGSVGNDGLPVQMFVNGDQLGIVSNGKFYIDNGLGPYIPAPLVVAGTALTYDRSGTASVAGNILTWIAATAGVNFTGMVGGDIIIIDGVVRHVSFVVSAVSIILTESLPTSALVTYAMYAVQWDSGSTFATLKAGDQISIGGGGAVSISRVDHDSRLNLVQSYGNFGSRTYTVSILNGLVHVSGNTADWVSGDKFTLYGLIGQSILLNGTARTVVSVASYTSLTFGGGAMADDPGVSYGINPAIAAASGAFLDSFFIVSPPNSKQINVSAPQDGRVWDVLDTAVKESYPDNIGTLFADHEELYVMGESKSEVWRSPGVDANFPFQRDPGACMSEGIAAPASLCGFLDGVAWIGASLRGQPVAYYAKGYQPERISTHAIEQVWASYGLVSDAVAFSFSMEGHEFWQISFPTGDATWIYDRTSSLQFGKAMWFERSTLSGGLQHRFRGTTHAFVWNKHWVGDFATGAIYQMASTIYTDAGAVITCQRTLPHLSAERLRQFFLKLQLDLETAIGGVAMTVVLDWSDDGGTTWSGGGSAYTWTTSTTLRNERVVFWQLGSADDRVFRVTITGNCRKAIMAAFLDSIQGT